MQHSPACARRYDCGLFGTVLMATHRHKWTGRTVPRLPSSTWPAGSASACAAAQTDWTSQPGNKQSQARNQQASKKKLSKSTHTSTHNSVQAVNFQERDKEAVPSHALYAFPAAKQAQQYCVIHTFCTNPKGSEPIKLPWTTGSWQLVSEELVSVRGPNTEADWEKLTDALPASSDEAKQSLLHKVKPPLQLTSAAPACSADNNCSSNLSASTASVVHDMGALSREAGKEGRHKVGSSSGKRAKKGAANGQRVQAKLASPANKTSQDEVPGGGQPATAALACTAVDAGNVSSSLEAAAGSPPASASLQSAGTGVSSKSLEAAAAAAMSAKNAWKAAQAAAEAAGMAACKAAGTPATKKAKAKAVMTLPAATKAQKAKKAWVKAAAVLERARVKEVAARAVADSAAAESSALATDATCITAEAANNAVPLTKSGSPRSTLDRKGAANRQPVHAKLATPMIGTAQQDVPGSSQPATAALASTAVDAGNVSSSLEAATASPATSASLQSAGTDVSSESLEAAAAAAMSARNAWKAAQAAARSAGKAAGKSATRKAKAQAATMRGAAKTAQKACVQANAVLQRAKQLQVNEVAARVVADSAAAESSALATDAACITAEAANNGVPLTKSASPRTTVDAVAVVVPPTETAAPSSAAAKVAAAAARHADEQATVIASQAQSASSGVCQQQQEPQQDAQEVTMKSSRAQVPGSKQDSRAARAANSVQFAKHQRKAARAAKAAGRKARTIERAANTKTDSTSGQAKRRSRAAGSTAGPVEASVPRLQRPQPRKLHDAAAAGPTWKLHGRPPNLTSSPFFSKQATDAPSPRQSVWEALCGRWHSAGNALRRFAIGAVVAALWRAVTGALLACWRLLPFALRSCFWRKRPQTLPLHASPRMARMLAMEDVGEAVRLSQQLGFDSTGRCPDPLADLPRWRVEALLGLPVCNLDLYRAAFTCSSVLPDDLVVDKSFERLEYLGDSVLELAIRDYIFKRYPTATEGFLSQLQQSLGSGRAVYDYAWHLHLERFLVLNISAMVASKAQRYSSYSKVTGDVFEAVVAAVYLEHGYETAKRWIIKIMEELVDFNRAVEGRLAWQTLVRYANKNKLGRLEFNTRFGAAEKLQAGQAKAQEWIRRNAGRWLEEQWVSQVMLSTGEVLGCGSDIHRSTAELLASQDAIARLGASAPHILQAADLRFRA